MNDIHNDIHREIRSLLSRWYDADTTRAEEACLRELLRSARDLPEDLEKDRMLFLSLYSLGAENLADAGLDALCGEEMPEELAARISDALEAEIGLSSDSRQTVEVVPQPKRSVWFRRFGATAGIAAALIGGILLLRPLFNAPVPASLTVENVATSLRDVNSGAEPVNRDTESGTSKTDIAQSQPRKTKVRKMASQVEQTPEDDWEDYGYLSEEEEALLVAENYRVISDEREAYAMVNTVFSRLEGHMIQEDCRLDGISAQYESEISNLYN